MKWEGAHLAQIFEVPAEPPAKAELYLKRGAVDDSGSFDLTGGTYSIDATNFASIDQRENKIIFAADTFGQTGNGIMRTEAFGGSEGAVLRYPVRTDEPGRYFVHVRTRFLGGGRLRLLLDGIEVDATDVIARDIWVWQEFELVLPDSGVHDLGLQAEGDQNKLDKIYITEDPNDQPDFFGPALDDSPFVTLHLQLYNVDSTGSPSSPVPVYDHKTTRDEVTRDDWYNFSLESIDESVEPVLTELAALVLSSSGARATNYVLWELLDNDEYGVFPSALKTAEIE